jgi:preprotein translocase subunit SecF
MEFFKKQTSINFMGYRRYTVLGSLVLWLASIVLLATQGLQFGLDFTGGTQIEARFNTSIEVASVREELEHQGFRGVRVQQYGSTQDLLIRVAHQKNEEEQVSSQRVKATLVNDYPGVEIRRMEFVGSEVGSQLVQQGLMAIVISILATMIYIAFRFEYRLAVSAAVGLLHDAILLLGIFSLFKFEFDLATLASVLAVLGYSLNDTIVVFDRVRENFRKVRKGTPVDIMNLSINQTLSRTIMTSLMTMLVVLALLFFGGESLFGFSMAFFVGILIGTFSSIYVSGALALWMGLSKADLMLKPKVSLDEIP